MREAQREQEILQQATTALETVTGLHADARFEPGAVVACDAILDIQVDGRTLRFAAEVKTVDRFQTLGLVKARADTAPYPLLLVAPYITEATAQKCRQLKLSFIDGAGNVYLEAPGLLVYVAGKPRPTQARAATSFLSLTPAGLRVIFALIQAPERAAAPYRDIARVARVSLGTVSDALADLEARGLLAPDKPGPRRLLARDRLLDEWVAHYPVKLRPKLHLRRFTAPRPDWWRGVDIGQYQACWGGEVAAAKLTSYLTPEQVTIYAAGTIDQLVLAHRLRPDARGEIEILDAFWTREGARKPTDVAPPVLVYADLMATNDARNIETATMIREQNLTDTRHPAR